MSDRPLGVEDIPSGRYTNTAIISERLAGFTAKAVEVDTERRVFIKVRDTAVLERAGVYMENEANVLEELSHPQIPKLIDADLAIERPYIVTEAMPGDANGEDWFAYNANAELAAQICHSALKAIGHMHQRGFIHRDIKPDNLVISEGPSAALIDPEMAWRVGDEADKVQKMGTVSGTAGFIAPERMTGRPGIGFNSDLFSLGSTYFLFLKGTEAFEGDNVAEVFKANCYFSPDFAMPHHRHVPEGLLDIAKKAMAREHSMRYSCAEEMAEDIERFFTPNPAKETVPSRVVPVLRPNFGRVA